MDGGSISIDDTSNIGYFGSDVKNYALDTPLIKSNIDTGIDSIKNGIGDATVQASLESAKTKIDTLMDNLTSLIETVGTDGVSTAQRLEQLVNDYVDLY